MGHIIWFVGKTWNPYLVGCLQTNHCHGMFKSFSWPICSHGGNSAMTILRLHEHLHEPSALWLRVSLTLLEPHVHIQRWRRPLSFLSALQNAKYMQRIFFLLNQKRIFLNSWSVFSHWVDTDRGRFPGACIMELDIQPIWNDDYIGPPWSDELDPERYVDNPILRSWGTSCASHICGWENVHKTTATCQWPTFFNHYGIERESLLRSDFFHSQWKIQINLCWPQ